KDNFMTLINNLDYFIKDIEYKIEDILSKINSDLESDHKNFLDNIKDVRKIKDNISEKLKKVTLTFYLNKERKILTSKDNLKDFRKCIEDKIENILSKINPDLESDRKKFLDDI